MIRSCPQIAANQPFLHESHRLGMAEMGFRGISEQWLMRRAGDLHWQLIAAAMGQADTAFTCAAGRPLYAAFCVTRLRIFHPDLARLGAVLSFSARLYSIGRSRLGSILDLWVGDKVFGRIELVSVFVGHETPGQNKSIVRRAPRALVVPPPAPQMLYRLAQRAAAIAAAPPVTVGSCHRLTPCPAVDFNAAGLLYFPSFAALAERARFAQNTTANDLLRTRTTLYMGNLDPGDAVEITFKNRRAGYVTAFHAPDGKLIALGCTTLWTKAQKGLAAPGHWPGCAGQGHVPAGSITAS